MYKHLLVATDGSDLAMKAVTHAAVLAKALGAKLTVATVTDPWPVLEMAQKAQEKQADPIGTYEKHAAEWADGVLAKAAQQMSGTGVSFELLHIKDMYPSDGILDAVTSHNCDAIIMSTHGRRGLRKVVLGSQASDVITHAQVPVIIIK